MLAEQFRAPVNLQKREGQGNTLRAGALRLVEKAIDVRAARKQSSFFIGHGQRAD